MYQGHILLILAIIIILSCAFVITKYKRNAFRVVCYMLSLFFLGASVVYFLELFLLDVPKEGYQFGIIIKLLTQNEDFLVKSNRSIGLYWGAGISCVLYILGKLSKKLIHNHTDS